MTNTNILTIKHQSKDVLFRETANRCEARLMKALTDNEKASFIVPGGTTPAPLFDILSKKELDWKNVSIALSDERWVDSQHPQSNQALVERNLFKEQASAAKFVAMKNSAETVFEGEPETNFQYSQLKSPFSLTLLGMGKDGHVASLFPKKNIIDSALDTNSINNCVAVDASGCEVAGEFPQRMSLTFDAILNSELIIILIVGKTKIEVLEQITNDTLAVDYPVSVLLNQTQTPVEIHWCE
ncbi:MAG: 6-phosphogluconolactonase [Kangiellaceae bacterium]|nr:6-phosphogluconolactonase [Kangiellaceae bacterium]